MRIPKGIFAILGGTLALIGLSVGLYLGGSYLRAKTLDTFGEHVEHRVSQCTLVIDDVSIEKRVFPESDSQALTVRLAPFGGMEIIEGCQQEQVRETVMILTPDFDVSPPEIKRTVVLPTTDVVWILRPKRSGTFAVTVQTGHDFYKTIGLTVTNMLGLSPFQAQVLSLLSTFLGPLLTAPWWYERWKEQRDKKASPKKRKK
jgi:hypothetical protein